MAGEGRLRVGTSGYAYKEWKGTFYPAKMPDKEMLKFYGQQFGTVEINYSFYRMPKESVLQQWAATVPEGFRFALKANQKITHIKRLRDCEEVLKRFLALRPRAFAFAFEVRHASWYTDETYELLRKHDTALCLAETEKETPLEILTADFTYLRLRRETYTAKQIKTWRERIDGWLAKGVDVNVYFKHEDSGTAPKYARQLLSGSAEQNATTAQP